MTSAAKILACAAAGLIGGLAWLPAASHAEPSGRATITCPYPGAQGLQLIVEAPAKMGDLPPIEFDYPAKVTRFSFRDGHLLLIAMDSSERSRVRVVISAQLNKAKGTYDGQMVTDLGGHQIMIDEGPVSCTVSR